MFQFLLAIDEPFCQKSTKRTKIESYTCILAGTSPFKIKSNHFVII